MKRLSLVAESLRVSSKDKENPSKSLRKLSSSSSSIKSKKKQLKDGLHAGMDVELSSQAKSLKKNNGRIVKEQAPIIQRESSSTATTVPLTEDDSSRTWETLESSTPAGKRGRSTRKAKPQPTRKKATRQRSSSLSELRVERRRTTTIKEEEEEEPIIQPAKSNDSSVSTDWAKSSSAAVERIEARKEQMAAKKKKKKEQALQQKKEQEWQEEVRWQEELQKQKEQAKAVKAVKPKKKKKLKTAKVKPAAVKEPVSVPPGAHRPEDNADKKKEVQPTLDPELQKLAEEYRNNNVSTLDSNSQSADSTDAATALAAFLGDLVVVTKEEALDLAGRAEGKPRRRKPTRQRSRSLTSAGRLGRRSTEERPPPPKPKRTFFFDDEYQDNVMVKLDSTAVEREVNQLQTKIREWQQQLEESQNHQQEQMQQQENKCQELKESFTQKMNDSAEKLPDAPPPQDLSDELLRTKHEIASLKKENAVRRKDNQKLRVTLFDLNQKTVRLERVTESTLQYVQELEEVHLVHEQDKNEALHRNLRIYRQAEDKLQSQLERREWYGEMEHRVRERYARTISAMEELIATKCKGEWVDELLLDTEEDRVSLVTSEDG